jgi:hypothetical protein
MQRSLVWALAGALLAAGGCASSSKPAGKAEVPAGYNASDETGVAPGHRYDQPMAKTNPNVVEETDTYYITRYKKSDVIRVDDTHFRLPVMGIPFKIYKQDAEYFYTRTEKYSPEEIAARQEKARAEEEAAKKRADELAGRTSPEPPPEPIEPPRAASGVRLVRAGAGLPQKGQWRSNLAVADVDGDGHLDIVAAPPRLSGRTQFYVFLGDGKGAFRSLDVRLTTADGKPLSRGVTYGGAQVADFDGDGKADVAVASHAGGVHVFLQRGPGLFQEDSRGLPGDLSAQALAAVDANGDGRPDLVVSRDSLEMRKSGFDEHQVRLFLNGGKSGWTYAPDGVVRALYSNKIFPFDADGDGTPGFVTGSNYYYGVSLVWRLARPGVFEAENFDAIEPSAYHQSVAPGRFGAEGLPAFAALYSKAAGTPLQLVAGINVYVHRKDGWIRVPVWRQVGYKGRVNAGMAMGDLDGDGLDDIVFPDEALRRLRIFFQTRRGTFEEAPEAAEPELDSPVVDVRLADLTGSGRKDVILAKTVYTEDAKDLGGLEVLLNRGR